MKRLVNALTAPMMNEKLFSAFSNISTFSVMAHSTPKSSDKPSKRSAVYLLNLSLMLFSTDTTPLRVEDSIILNLQDIWL